MPQVTVTIGGRDYKMACGDGEEEHLLALGRLVDERHGELKRSFGEVGDVRLSVMTAIMIADELNEAKRRHAALEQEIERLRDSQADAASATDGRHAETAGRIAAAAERLERLADELTDGARRD
ncbi:cell division protein ZapA [Methylopila musalis]|uniref:Cell division protein ZapA n=2 Tax=Methylopila TaxID=61653 RepID=A0A9W6JIW3_9HYPH|nr:cell division protein ZapA [Methylopila jiangsuensis]MDR6286436.1 cell division protein ZapA [Methylopila jiangsuensis]GLK77226.1 cell division protein ZapA [Methylopila jiangsuensis]